MHSQSLHFGSLLYMIMITLRLCFAASDYAISSFNLLINLFLLLDLLGDIELYDSIQCECDSVPHSKTESAFLTASISPTSSVFFPF